MEILQCIISALLIYRTGPRHVDAPGRLIIWRPFKPMFFKYMLKIYLVGRGETDLILTYTFRQLCKESRVEMRGNWHHISHLFQWF
jgi:hypothetical protein